MLLLSGLKAAVKSHTHRLSDTWLQPGADEAEALSRFNDFQDAPKLLKRLNLSELRNTGLKSGVNEQSKELHDRGSPIEV